MASEIKKEIKLEIGHFLFMDIVGYSKLLINEQRAARETLNQIVRSTETFRETDATGTLIKSPTGDGMALVFRESPEQPVECALEVNRALHSHPELPLRMGIHSGPVSAVTDVNDTTSVAGAGINMAQRVMDCGDAGHILISKHVAEDLEQYTHWKPYLHDLGECEVKHGVRLHLFNFCGDNFGNATIPARVKQAAKIRARKRLPLLIAAGALAVILTSVVIWQYSRRSYNQPPARSIATAPDKSIAVLPFENLSEDKSNAYFVAGIQDEILTRLAKIADLKVISRTSTQNYKSKPGNLSEIAKQLGVANILEGSVQKSGEAVHITVQLISGHTDAHLWAESYDRELKNIFSVEREVAETVAVQLKAKLLPQEATELARVPTTNPQAYDLYLRAKYIDWQFWNAQVDSNKPAIDFYRQAIALDPGFALAYASLAQAELIMYRGGEDRSPERIADTQANAEKSLALQPDLIEGHIARAEIYYSVKHDYASALAEFEPLLKRSANDPELTESMAWANVHAGNVQAGLTGMLRACELDPRNSQYLRWVADFYGKLRRYPEADQTYEKALALAPDDSFARLNRAGNLIDQGKLADAREVMKARPDTELTETALSIKYSTLQQIETLSRNYDAALTYGLKIPAMGNRITAAFGVGDIKKNTDIGFDALYKGDTSGAHQAFTAAREGLDSERAGHLDDPEFFRYEALIAAGMDNREAAVKAARKAVALVPIESDAILGPYYLLTLAQVYAHFGDADQAVPLIGKLLDIPGWSISPALLRLDPIWDPIRNDPRFEKLAASTTPK